VPRPARDRTTIRPRSRRPCGPSPASRITAMISSTLGRSAGYRGPLLCGARPAWNPGIVAGERRRPARSSNSSDMTPPRARRASRRSASKQRGDAKLLRMRNRRIRCEAAATRRSAAVSRVPRSGTAALHRTADGGAGSSRRRPATAPHKRLRLGTARVPSGCGGRAERTPATPRTVAGRPGGTVRHPNRDWKLVPESLTRARPRSPASAPHRTLRRLGKVRSQTFRQRRRVAASIVRESVGRTSCW
jgi:hypothetical protein